MKRKIPIFLLCIFLGLLPNVSGAVTVEELQAQINNLTKEIQNLGGVLTADFQFSYDLYSGMKNNPEVSKLQDFLIESKYLNIPASTGNFYALTSRAVLNYQIYASIKPTGYFGPITRARVNEELRLKRNIKATGAELKLAPVREVKPALVSPPSPPPSPEPSPLLEPQTQLRYQIRPKPYYDLNLISKGIQDLINQERQKAGLGQLAWYDSLAQVAKLHSTDQVADNIELTNPDILCHYPLIRHEGIRGGYSITNRLNAGGISSYRLTGENIVMFSTGKNFTYEYKTNISPLECKYVATFSPGEGIMEERLKLFNDVLRVSQDAVRSSPSVNWINKEWLLTNEVERRAVELWLNSPGHRANILRPDFNYGGIGITAVNDYLIITQNFMGR